MPTWLTWILPIIIPVLTPFVVAGAKWLGEYFGKVLPSNVVPIVAVAVGELMNQLSTILGGIPLPPSVTGLIAIGVREVYDQLAGKKLSGEAVMGFLALVFCSSLIVGCGGSGGSSNSVTDVRDCDIETSPEQVVASEEDPDTKELTVICGDGQVGDNSSTVTTVNDDRE